MRHLHALVAFAFLMMFTACANVDPTPVDSPPLVSEQHQALGEDFCETHPVACEAFERLCAAQPSLCDELCAQHPSLPFCSTASSCDPEDPNYEPCGEGEACYRGECVPTADPGDCIPRGEPCDPNAANTCCHDVPNIPSSPQDVCEDPFGEGAVCVPAP